MTVIASPRVLLRALSIRTRLILGFGLLILLLVAASGAGAWRMAQLSASAREVAEVDVRLQRLVGEWFSLTRANAVRAVVLTHSDDAELRGLLGPAMESTTQRISALQQQVEALLPTQEARTLFQHVGERRQAYLDARRAVLEKKKGGDAEGARSLMTGTMVPAVDRYVASIETMLDATSTAVARDVAAAEQGATATRNLLVAFCAGGVLLAFVAGTLITRSITRPIREAVDTARRVADGDLTVRIDTASRDEMGLLLRALDDMAGQLRQVIGEVAAGSRGVADSSGQIAQGNADLSQRTEEQASTLQETASSMEELTSTVAQNADNARSASQLATVATGVAREGGEAVAQVVRTMRGIAGASKKIEEIIGVIDGIAFQTNILALNAAVEAARAGDQGRGFAVVAAEVRSLAQRSATAAREIKGLILDSVQQVEAGAQQVDGAGRKMEAIVEAVRQVSDLIAEIASASQEQSSGIEQVNTAIAQIDQTVQQNASLVEEAAATTEAMKVQAEALLQTVRRFRVDPAGATAAGTAYAPAARPRMGNSFPSPSAITSTASAARISPISLVSTLMPVRPSTRAIGSASANEMAVTSATTTP